MFKRIRVAILLFILASVALGTWKSQSRTRSWESTLYVSVFPINADGSEASARHIAALEESSFEAVEEYLDAQAREHGLAQTRPVMVSLGPRIERVPPPRPRTSSALDAIRWSLTIRYWAWVNTPATAPKPDIRLYALYYDPAAHPVMPESTGLQKGQIGLAHLFAEKKMHGSNLVILTHEMLHTLGATDLYDLRTTLPRYPDGYARPRQSPLYPQPLAELMAGRIPLSKTQADIPRSLGETVIGARTASEIGWLRDE